MKDHMSVFSSLRLIRSCGAIVDAAIGSIAAIISAVFSVTLYLELADSAFSKVLFGAMAGVFEAAKIRLWQKRTTSWWFVLLSIMLVSVSLVASAGAASVIVERVVEKVDEDDEIGVSLQADLQALYARREILLERYRNIPPTWLAKAHELETSLDVVDDDIDYVNRLIQESDMQKKLSGTLMFDLLARYICIDRRTFIVCFFMALSVLLELALLTLMPAKKQNSGGDDVSVQKTTIRSKDGGNNAAIKRKVPNNQPCLFGFSENDLS